MSRRDYLQKIFSLIYDAKEKTPSLILFFQKNVIELLLEKYFRSGKLIIRALFLQLTSGVDLFFTIVNLTKCIHITAMFLQMEQILANAVLQNLNRNFTHMYKKNRQPDKHNKVRWSVLILWLLPQCFQERPMLFYTIILCWISIVVQIPYKYFS